MSQHIFSSSSELQNIPGTAPSSPSLSVSERLARYGSDSFSAVEHLSLWLLGQESEHQATTLLRHFGSFTALSRASFEELRQFVSKTKAERLVAALRVSAIAICEEASSLSLDTPERVFQVCQDTRFFSQETLRVVLVNTRIRFIKSVEITKGTLNGSLAHPREIFRPAIVSSAFAFVVVRISGGSSSCTRGQRDNCNWDSVCATYKASSWRDSLTNRCDIAVISIAAP
jgi:DNA repair protein RadC